MPLTPLHLGPALLLGYPLARRLDVPTLLLASVALDVRAWSVILGPLSGPVHGPLHTLVGATAFAVALAGVVSALRPKLPASVRWVSAVQRRLSPHREPVSRRDGRRVLAGALVGVYSHVLLDAVVHDDVRPFFPAESNPLLGVAPETAVDALCVATGLLGVVLWTTRIRWNNAYDDRR